MRVDKSVCIIGLGYVGLTLAIALVKRGVRVYGVEQNMKILQKLGLGHAHFKETGIDEELRSSLKNGLFTLHREYPEKVMDFCIITVGTPLDENHEVHFSSLEKAIDGIPYVTNPDEFTLILRSTVAVGTTKALLPSLDQRNIKNVCFAPERTIEGNALEELYNLPQIIGASNTTAMTNSKELFKILTDHIVEVSSIEIAELAKLFNNTYRDINFAIGNYFSLIAQQFGADGLEAIQAANKDYKRGGVPMPGFVGGPCLEKDPHILSFRKYSENTFDLLTEYNFTKLGREFNEQLVPSFSNMLKTKTKGKKVLLTGVAFKGRPATSDLRGSMSIKLMRQLLLHGDDISLHDFEAFDEEVFSETGRRLVPLPETPNKSMVLLICNNHQKYSDLSTDYLNTFDMVIDIQGALTENQKSRLTSLVTFGSIGL